MSLELFEKFGSFIENDDGSEEQIVILEINSDPIALAAMYTYARELAVEGNEQLSNELFAAVARVRAGKKFFDIPPDALNAYLELTADEADGPDPDGDDDKDEDEDEANDAAVGDTGPTATSTLQNVIDQTPDNTVSGNVASDLGDNLFR